MVQQLQNPPATNVQSEPTTAPQQEFVEAPEQETTQEEPQKKRAGRPPGGGKSANGNGKKAQRSPRGLRAELLLPDATIDVDGLEVPGLDYVLDWLIYNVIKPLGLENDLASLLDLNSQAWTRYLGKLYTDSGQRFVLRQQMNGILEAAKRNPEFSSAAPEILSQVLKQAQQGLRDASAPKELPQATDAVGF